MGTDINGAFGHRITFPPTESLAQSMRVGIQPVSPIFQGDWSVDPNDYASSRRLISIHGYGLSVLFGPHAALIPSGYAWPGPMEHSNEQQLVIWAIRAVARFFRSPRVIFLPDDIEPWCDIDTWIAEGLTLEELQQRLARIREPSPDFSAAIRQSPDSWQVDGYVVEELEYDAI